MNGALQENIAGIRIVKAFSLEEKEEERIGETCRDYYERNLSVARTSAKFHAAIGFLAGAGVALVLYVGGRAVAGGRLSLGGFVAFNACLAMLAFPTMAMGWVINLFQRGSAAMGRINEYLQVPSELSGEGPALSDRGPVSAPDRASSPQPLLEVRGLSFSYDDGSPGKVLRDLSFTIGKGEVVGLAGPTGGGKSTLLSLLAGLYPAPPGTILWEGRDAAEIPLQELRGRVALVPQDPFLFSDTLLENIRLGKGAADPKAAREAARAARLLDEIEELPKGFETVVGERGISLSGGQKQRATIARALCAGRPILLLDDALSSVDSETEREIFREILSARGEGTVLFSTHRMGSLSRCDRILVLDGGRIVEEGTHDRLFSMRGSYYELYSRQMIAREIEEST
jgi:ATP-binding cassette subfamily B protein